MQVVVGRIGRPHGLRGEVSVEVRTDDPERRLAPGLTLQTDPAVAGPLTIVTGRVHSGRLLLTFEGVGDRTGAEGLRGVLLLAEIDPDERPEDPEEFFDHQLVGLLVSTVEGEPVGEVTEMLHLPGQDVLVLRRPDGREALVPFVMEIVPGVDLEGGRLVIDPPPGLLDENP
ncbi:MAG: rRNA processing protein RimM [Actinomycetota bacterium]|nr:rRNA processing protein RimM [Actinomycetota bacterium]